MAKRLSVKEASRQLQVNENAIRRGMAQGELPIGSVISGEKEKTYLIYQEKIDAYLGKSQESVKVIDRIIKYLARLKCEYDLEKEIEELGND